MESISNSLSGDGLLLNQMQSGAALKKAQVAQSDSAEAPGNVLATFGDMLKNQINNVNQLQAASNEATQTYAVGGDIELHNVIIAADKASLAMDLTLQIRNKLVQAYQEVSRMNI